MSERKRILYILPQPYLVPRGSSFRAMATVDVLAELGYQVDLLCYPLGNDPRNKKYSIARSANPFSFGSVKIGPSWQKIVLDIPLAWSAWRMVGQHRYDLIHGVEEAGFLACLLGKWNRIPYIFDMHSWMSQQINDGNFLRSGFLLSLFKKAERYAMRQAKAIITVGEEMTGIIKNDLVPESYTVTLPDRSLALHEPLDPVTAENIRKNFFSGPEKKILYTGNFHPYQGIDLLLASVRELRQSVANPFKLLLVGGGEGERDKVIACKDMCQLLGINENVVFCGEFPPEAMPVFIENSDLVVTSRITGNNIPLKIYTYLASGKLLVATRIQSHTQVLHKGNALLAEPDPVSFARELRRGLYELNELDRERLASEAKRTGGEEHFRKFQDILVTCYGYCLKSRSNLS